MDRWNPCTGRYSTFELDETMGPLEEFQSYPQVVSGLKHQHGYWRKETAKGFMPAPRPPSSRGRAQGRQQAM
jgi:hypothetical protein